MHMHALAASALDGRSAMLAWHTLTLDGSPGTVAAREVHVGIEVRWSRRENGSRIPPLQQRGLPRYIRPGTPKGLIVRAQLTS